jgi:CII-binding regulator of phage lambda lysogenization HflD
MGARLGLAVRTTAVANPARPVNRIARGGRGPSNPICLQLEQRLAQEANRGSQSRDVLPKLEADLRAADKLAQQGVAQLERQDCFEYFLFSKTLKRTRACVDLNTQVEGTKRRISELDAQRQQLISSSGRSYQDDIIRELARNNCGSNYQQEAALAGRGQWRWQ